MSVVLQALASGPIWGGVGVWIKSLETHFGWSRTQLTGASSLAQLEGSIIGPMIGYFIDRVGSRRMVIIGMLVIGVGFIIFSRTFNLTVFYLSFAVIMVGSAMAVWLPMMTAINRWFVRRRSTAMAIAGEGNYLGGIILVPTLAWAVNPDNYGWRITALGIGVVFLLVTFPLSLPIRDRPEDYGQQPDGGSSAESDPVTASANVEQRKVRRESLPDFTTKQAMLTSAFWLITVGHATSSMVNQTFSVHLIPLLTDKTLSLQMAAYVFAASQASAGLFQLVGGYLGDRAPKHLILSFFITIQTIAFAAVVLVDNTQMAFLIAVLYGIGHGGRNPLTTAIRGDYFGPRAFATITGISMAPMFLLQLVGPLFAAAMFDIRGSYVLPFTMVAGFGFLGSVAFFKAKPPELEHPQTAGMAGYRR